MSTVPARPVAAGQGLLLHDVDWRTYSRLLHAFAERPGVRLTYDRGSLEIMSLLFEQDSDAYPIGRFVDVLTEEMALPIEGGRSTTLRRRRRRRGLEPDNCFWIAHASQIQGRRRIDLRVDPPPDLAIEVDVTHSSLDRMSLYASLGVPEVWRLDGPNLTFHGLGADGKYTERTHSLAFPFVTPADLTRFLALHAAQDANAVVRQFRAWVRQQLAGGTPPVP
ncbi:MAG TPA: Uma2 family endonuclease [Gemmataceae bacterium]|nr:Uma2 family endonuclease [Gemmataceae bacterium]